MVSIITPYITKQLILKLAEGVKTFRDELFKQLTTYQDLRLKGTLMDDMSEDDKSAAFQFLKSDLERYGFDRLMGKPNPTE